MFYYCFTPILASFIGHGSRPCLWLISLEHPTWPNVAWQLANFWVTWQDVACSKVTYALSRLVARLAPNNWRRLLKTPKFRMSFEFRCLLRQISWNTRITFYFFIGIQEYFFIKKLYIFYIFLYIFINKNNIYIWNTRIPFYWNTRILFY